MSQSSNPLHHPAPLGNHPPPNHGSLFWHIPEPCLLADPTENRVLAVNKPACELLAMPAEVVEQGTFTSLFGAQLPRLISLTQAVLETGHAWSNDLYLMVGDTETPLEVSAQRYHWQGKDYILFLMLDCTNLEKQRTKSEINRYHRGGILHWQRIEQVFQDIEKENQLILSAAGEGIYGVDAEGKTTFMNPAGERLLGWRSDEVAGINIHPLIHHTHAAGGVYPEQDCPILATFRDGEVHRVTDEVFWRKDGTSIPVEYTSTPIFDNGQLVGAVVIFRDVSEQKKAEAQLRQALEEVEALKQKLELENAYLQQEIREEHNYHEIVGKSEAVRHIVNRIEMVAKTDANVLINGETGTGKELIARAIHQASSRKDRPLIRVNCAAIPRELFESEFFGHVKGAFTGAISHRTGRFELADGGTLFLDEVGEIPLELQSKLLRVLQDQQFERVGDTATRHVNVRVIAATNRDLKIDVEEKQFREDLYFRLNVFPIESAPLRERIEDIPLLATHFLERAAQRLNKPHLRLSMADMDNLRAYSWPGNIRELENVIERQVIVAQGTKMGFNLPADLPSADTHAPASNKAVSLSADEGPLTEDARRERDRQNIIAALKQCKGKVFGAEGAAELLGVKPTTLSSRLKKLGIVAAHFKQ